MYYINMKTILAASLLISLGTSQVCLAQEQVSKVEQIKAKAHAMTEAIRQGLAEHKKKVIAGCCLTFALLTSAIIYEGGLLNASARYNIKPLFYGWSKIYYPSDALKAAAKYHNKDLIQSSAARCRAHYEDDENVLRNCQGRALEALFKTRLGSDIHPAVGELECGFQVGRLGGKKYTEDEAIEILKMAFALGYRMDPWNLGTVWIPERITTSLYPIRATVFFKRFKVANFLLDNMVIPEQSHDKRDKEILSHFGEDFRLTKEVIIPALESLTLAQQSEVAALGQRIDTKITQIAAAQAK